MLKTTRKLTALLLSLVMILSLAVTAFGNETGAESKATEAQVEATVEEPTEASAEAAATDETEAENEPELVNEDPAPAEEAGEDPAEGEEQAEEADDDSTEAAAENDEEDSEEDTTVAETVTEAETETETVVDSVEETTAEAAVTEEVSSETETESVSETTAEPETETTTESETETTVEPTTESTTEAPTAEAPTEEPETEPVVENAITVQPQDLSVCAYDTANFSVETTGEVSSYRWEYSTNGKKWYSVGYYSGRNADYSFIALKSDNNCQFRVKVTFADKTTVTSAPAKLKIVPSSITENPQDLTVAPGEKASFTVGLNGTASSVQWQVSENGKRWSNLSRYYYGNTTTLSFIAEAEDDGLLVRAVVSTKDGSKLTTTAAKLTVTEAAPEMPAQDFENVEVNGASVSASSPEGAFPADTSMNVAEVEITDEAILEAVAGSIVKAFDISFENLDGEEIEPEEGSKVTVTLKSDAVKEGVKLIHIDDNGNVTEVSEEDIVSIADGEIVFQSDAFSVYAVVREAFENNQQYVIYTGTTALAYNGNNLTTATVTVENGTVVRSSSDNIVWTVTLSGNAWHLSTGSRYLQYQRNNNDTLRTTSQANNEGTSWTYEQYYHRLSASNGNRTRYLSYSNGTWGLTNNTSNAAAVYIAQISNEPATGDLTYNYYNADHSASISAAETIAETDYTTTWTNVSTLAKAIPGYQFLEARANSADGDVITQVNGRAYRQGTETSGNGHVLNSIYFIYMRDYVAGEDVIPGLNGPETEKKVTQNTDGTFTIQLDVTGVVNDVKHGANVVVVFDRTYSMNSAMSNSDSTKRIDAAISAVNTMVNTLNPGDPSIEGQYDIDFALVEFDRHAEDYDFGTNGITGHTNWTKSGDALKTRVSRYANGANLALSGQTAGNGGTNWQEALQETAAVLENKPDADPTYVVFMTDGEPTIYIGSEAVNTNRSATDPEYTRAVPYATAIVNADYLMYDIFCSASDTTLLQSLYTTSGAKSYVKAETTTAIENAFKAVAQDMIDAIGSSNYGADDGVPSMGSFDLATVDGVAQLSEARYYIKTEDSADFVEWDDAPVATPSSGGVKWDLSSIGTLAGGTVYRVEFEIWPSQEALDLIADLNNGLRSYDADGENPITDAQRAQIDEHEDGSYTLKTNTYLMASYKLYGENHNEEVDFTADAMPLPTRTISVKKFWPENLVDEYGIAAYRDPVTGETQYATEVRLTLQREVNNVRENYLDFVVSKDGADGVPGTDDDWMRDDIYVSCGFMTVKNGVVEIKESGHDYQIVEPPEFLYYWDLISEVYHPMVINGHEAVLIYDPTITEADVANGIYEIPADSQRFYRTSTNTANTLEASNFRRSNLNLAKYIPESADQDAEFVFKGTVTDSYSSDGNVWFSAWDISGGGDGVLVTENWVTGEGVVAQGDGYFYAPNGTELTMTIKTNWNVRFLNLYHGSTFSFEEVGMPHNFEFNRVETETQWDFMLSINEGWYTIEKEGEGEAAVQTGKITGKITEPNNYYYVNYFNEVKPEFYIYHSSVAVDGDLETINMSDKTDSAWNTNGTFNLYSHTKPNNLYGGYYLDYEGKGTYEDDGVKGVDGVAYDGWNVEWSGAQIVIGTAITPVAGETYYIKEVPTYYLRNYHQINYFKSGGNLTGLYLISAIDDLNYQETGLVLRALPDGEEDIQTSSVTTSVTYRNTATNKSITLKANTIFRNKGITGEGSENNYLTFWDATNTDYFDKGSFTVLPYWTTPDGITVKGISTRTITITVMTRTGISQSEPE